MPRRSRPVSAGLIFHVLNRGSRKGLLFATASDYQAFEALLRDAVERFGVALFSYCLMPNHWHFIIRPGSIQDLSRFMHWLTTTHARRWRLARQTNGEGAVYQGRFKAVPVADDEHFLWACRYVERNACRASLVDRAEDWRWNSVWQRREGATTWLSAWPVPEPADWVDWLNEPQPKEELEAFREATRCNQPFGSAEWRSRLAHRGKRPAGRPRTGVLEK